MGYNIWDRIYGIEWVGIWDRIYGIEYGIEYVG